MFASVLTPGAPQARDISNLFVATLLIAAAIFGLVIGLLIYAIVRYRARPDQPDPEPAFGRVPLEVAWTAAPAALLAVMFVITLVTMRSTMPSNAQGGPDLVVVGHQWWWEVRYPHTGAVTANEIHLPIGRRLLVELDSGDVIHNFWLPELNGKMQMVPGQRNYIWLQADRPGVYGGACSEFCGVEHAWMRLRAVAEPPARFAAWQAAQVRAARPATGPDAVAGARLFLQLTCVSCHAIPGSGANARVGPDLSHLGSRATLGAGVLSNTPANLARWLRNPQEVKPGNHMPNLYLSDAQVRALTAYLGSLR